MKILNPVFRSIAPQTPSTAEQTTEDRGKKVNLREGTRRLALLLGVVGAILGGLASYVELQTVLNQRARHNKFGQLADSDVVQRERKCRLAGMTSGCSDDPYAATAIQAPAGDPYAATAQARKQTAPRAPKKAERASIDYDALADQVRKEAALGRKYEITEPDGTPLASEVNKGGIKTVHWVKDYGVESIETGDGQTLYPTPAPSAWTYLLIALFPILGFFIPWGAVRAIGWVGAGFAASPK